MLLITEMNLRAEFLVVIVDFFLFVGGGGGSKKCTHAGQAHEVISQSLYCNNDCQRMVFLVPCMTKETHILSECILIVCVDFQMLRS